MSAPRKIAILISGRGSNMSALLDACARPGFPAEPVLALANNPGAAGLAHAAAAGVAAETLDHRPFNGDRAAFERALDARLRAAGAEMICLAGFMRLLTPWFVERWRDRMLNVHPSLLPAFMGLDTHARAIAAGVRFHGCTVHVVRPAMDDGPILAQAAVPVLQDDDANALSARVLTAEHRIYPEALRLFASGRTRVVGERVVVDGQLAAPEITVNPLPEP